MKSCPRSLEGVRVTLGSHFARWTLFANEGEGEISLECQTRFRRTRESYVLMWTPALICSYYALYSIVRQHVGSGFNAKKKWTKFEKQKNDTKRKHLFKLNCLRCSLTIQPRLRLTDCTRCLLFVVLRRFGRKRTVLGFHIVKMVGSVISLYSPNYIIFIISRFIIAVGSTASNLATFIIGETFGCFRGAPSLLMARLD